MKFEVENSKTENYFNLSKNGINIKTKNGSYNFNGPLGKIMAMSILCCIVITPGALTYYTASKIFRKIF